MKKKFDSDFAEMQRSFDQARREKMELEGKLKKLSITFKELQQQLEEEVRQKNEFYDKLNMQVRSREGGERECV